MSDVKQADIDLVINGLVDFFQQSIKRGGFDFLEFVNIMEHKFEAAGYRAPQGGGL